MLYVPGGREGISYSPAEFVVAARDKLVSLFTIVTDAPGTAAPVASCTDPSIVPLVDCAHNEYETRAKATRAKPHRIIMSGLCGMSLLLSSSRSILACVTVDGRRGTHESFAYCRGTDCCCSFVECRACHGAGAEIVRARTSRTAELASYRQARCDGNPLRGHLHDAAGDAGCPAHPRIRWQCL